MNQRFVPKRKSAPLAALFGLFTICLSASPAFADCSKEQDAYADQINQYTQQLQELGDDSSSSSARKDAQAKLTTYTKLRNDGISACERRDDRARTDDSRHVRDGDECQRKITATHRDGVPDVYKWDEVRFRCINLADAKSLPDNDDCSSASAFAGQLKGQNCKTALNAVHDVRTRNSALTDATTAATTAYSSMQATGATGAQDDAQTRQANIMKTLALSKLATGAINLQGAMQLQNAATGAEQANSTITSAQKKLTDDCSKEADEQICFYQHAKDYGLDGSYANFDRMRRGATQSQEQADAANSLAKSSMITGAADMLIGLQAMKMAQMANQNVAAMAPPMMVPRALPPPVRFGDTTGATSAPTMGGTVPAPPIDYGNPAGQGPTFGNQIPGHIGGAMTGHMGTPNVSKSASSGVSGGGGGGSAGGGSLRGGGSGGKSSGGGKKNSAVGEYNLAGGGGFKGGGAPEKNDASNPMADMLAKLFPQGADGKPVVDARQIASTGELPIEGEQADNSVTATDLTLFEQISAKYRQLNDSGHF